MNHIKNIWPVVLLPVLMLVFYNDTLSVLHTSWVQWDQAYSHGYLIIGLIYFWMVRESLRESFDPNTLSAAFGLICLFTALFGWYCGKVIQLQVLEQVALLAIGWSWILLTGGWNIASRLMIPFAIGLLAIPLWDIMISPLQDMTVYVVSHATALFGLTAYIENNTIELPYGMLVVADGCAGLNLFLVSLSIGAIYSYMYLRKKRSIISCVLILLVLGVVTNWVRVFSLVVLGYVSKMESEIVYDHGTFGWMIFAGVLVVFFYFYRRVEATQEDFSGSATQMLRPSWMSGAGIVAITALPLWWNILTSDKHIIYSPRHLVIDQYATTSIETPPWQPAMTGYDLVQHWLIEGAERPIYLSVFSYTYQEQGKELIYYSNKIAEKYDMQKQGLAHGLLEESWPLNMATVKGKSDNVLVLWGYRVGHWKTASEMMAKILQLPASFSGNRIAELLTISIPCEGDCREEVLAVHNGKYKSVFKKVINVIGATKLEKAD